MRNNFYMKIMLIACASLLLMPGTVLAAGKDDTRPAEFKHYDNRLNKTYQTIISNIRKTDKDKLRNAQRAWIKMRDLDCRWASTAEPLDCMIDRTMNRERELRSSYFWEEDGSYTKLEP